MLIIFDLDDTLIDTSGSVTPFKLKACLQHMISLGLQVANPEEAEKALFEINERSEKSREALLAFAEHFSFNKEKINEVLSVLTSPLPEPFSIPTTPYAKEILEFFQKSHSLALVTGGIPSFQHQKMEKAGIDRSFFSKIEVAEGSIKKPVYQALLKEFSIAPCDAWVCGDRIEMDLVPAKELGMRTIQMRWGRGSRQPASHPAVDRAIVDLRQLKGWIQ